MKLMHVLVIEAAYDPLVIGFFRSEAQALSHAYELLEGKKFSQSSRHWDLDSWRKAIGGVFVTRFIAAHAPTGEVGRPAVEKAA